MTHLRIVACERVSTARQGPGRFAEVENGRRADRLKALHLAKVIGSTPVIAKLDRLSRNAAFLLALSDSGVRRLVADMPQANDLAFGIMAPVADQEREAIFRRTRETLEAAKARDVKLGNPNGAAPMRRASDAGAALRQTVTENADARDLVPVIETIRAEGATRLRGIAAASRRREARCGRLDRRLIRFAARAPRRWLAHAPRWPRVEGPERPCRGR